MSGQAPSGGRGSADKAALSRGRRYRETPDVSDAVGRLILTVHRRVATEDPPDLRYLLDLEAKLAEAMSVAVAGQRASGYSDADIGAALGVTRQAIQQRFPR